LASWTEPGGEADCALELPGFANVHTDQVALAGAPAAAHDDAVFINRDVSDLAFVERVLEEAENARNPVLDRARFLAISGMLLDEFYRIRVAVLREQIRSQPKLRSREGTKPSKQLKRADRYSNRLIRRQDACWRVLREDLKAAGIELVTRAKLTAEEREWLAAYFDADIRPRLVPTTGSVNAALDSVRNGGLILFAELAGGGASREDAVVVIPSDLPRFIALPGRLRLLPIEQAIGAFIDELFPQGKVTASGLARILREGNLKPYRNGDDALAIVTDAIERREHAEVIRLRVEHRMPGHLTSALAESLGLLQPDEIKALEKSRRRATASEFVVADSFLGLQDLDELPRHLPPELAARLRAPVMPPVLPAFVDAHGDDLFAAIRECERLLHFPYEDFGIIVKLLEQAVEDEAVVRIRQTLYRTGRESPVVLALAEAARRGKSVEVVIELEARDEETRNVELATMLRAAGAHVSYGVLDRKVHAKLMIIDRLESGTLERYVHCSTGNYDLAAGSTYTDLCLFSVDTALADDAEQLFAYAHARVPPRGFARIAVAPFGLRERVAGLIEDEIRHAESGRSAGIWLKVNRLSDEQMIRLLYRASRAGVDVRIIVRGICCLRPGVPGLSEHIHVQSVVGRYLEHSRALCFGNGRALPSESAAVFISSADLMAHKLDGRVEALVEIEAPQLKSRIQHDVFEQYFKDEANSWVLDADDRWERRAIEGFSVQRGLFG
jgi:polyphosphate kinase